MLDPKKQLDITLTEPVIFLRSSDPSGRLEPDPNDPPTLVRGILTLNVVKAIGISSIEVELTGLLTVNYPEGVTLHHTDLPEKHKIYSSTVTVFRADQVPHGKRSASAGPGLSAAISNNDEEHAATPLSRPPSSSRGGSERRSAVTVTPDLGPTPPYTPVAQPPTPIQQRVGAPGEGPAQTLEELRQALRDNLEGQPYRNALCEQLLHPSSLPHSIGFSLPNSTTHSNASTVSNEPLHREDDNTVHSSPPSTGDTSFHNTIEELPRILPHSRSYSPENHHGSQPYARGNSHDSSNTATGRSRLRLSLSTVLDAVMEATSRAPPRSRDVAGSEETERGRTRVRIIAEEQSRESIQGGEGIAGTGNSSQLAANASHPSTHMEHREHHLLGLGRVLGLQRHHEKEKDVQQKSKEQGEGWREFQPGTYSYPISFLLSPNLPPTFSVPRGSLNYTIKGVAHRPGTFTSKFSCQVPLLVVAAPTSGAGEGSGPGDPGPLFFQGQWEGKLAYSFALSSRLFLLGSQRHLEAAASDSIRANMESLVGAEAEAGYGTAILDLTLLPLEKIKIWRLSVVVDQRIRYLDGQRKLFRDEVNKRVRLLEVQDMCSAEEMGLVDEEESTHKNKHKHKHDLTQIPLLPTPVSPHRSPLLRYISPSADPSILAGPGPYTLSTSIGLPDCNDPSGSGLYFTVKQKSSVVRVEHSLRLVLRVEKVGDEGTDDHEEGNKKKSFDITVQAPITILSCRCVPECQTLPRYSPTTEDWLPNRAACPCQPGVTGPMERGQGHEVGSHLGHVITSSASTSFESEDGVGYFHRQADEQRSVHERSRSSSRARRSGHPSPPTTPLHSHPSSPASRTREAGWGRSPAHAQIHSHSQHHQSHSHSVSTSNVRAHSQATPVATPHSSRPPSPVARYERLVSGLESEAGEAPPSYESIASRF